jgi:hypothetical protein
MDFEGDPLGYWGRNIIEDYDDVLFKKLPADEYLRLQEAGPPSLPSLSKEGKDGVLTAGYPVGILGAGIGGLYTALILDSRHRVRDLGGIGGPHRRPALHLQVPGR